MKGENITLMEQLQRNIVEDSGEKDCKTVQARKSKTLRGWRGGERDCGEKQGNQIIAEE